MIGASRQALDELRERFDAQEAAASAQDLAALAADLRSSVHLLDREPALRRALGDPAQSAERKDALVRDLLRDKIGDPALDLLATAAGRRWSRPTDLADAIEQLAVVAEAGVAEKNGELDALEDELFRFGRIVDGQSELLSALSDPSAPQESKTRLLADLLEERTTAVTLRLITDLVLYPRGRSLERGLDSVAKYVAQRRRRLVALVRSAVNLTDRQTERLSTALGAVYGHEIHLNIEIDPDVIGGLSVQVGDEIIDGTVAGRLEEVRWRLA